MGSHRNGSPQPWFYGLAENTPINLEKKVEAGLAAYLIEVCLEFHFSPYSPLVVASCTVLFFGSSFGPIMLHPPPPTWPSHPVHHSTNPQQCQCNQPTLAYIWR